MASLEVGLFGGLQIQHHGQSLTLAYDKVRALLAFLLLESGRPHRRETLAGLLWPEQTEKEARHSLSQALHKLKQTIDPENSIVLADRQVIQLPPGIPIAVDTAEFAALLEACQGHRHAQPMLCERCMARRAAAVALYRGPLLSGLSLSDAPPFEQWLTQQRAFFHRQVMDELAKLAAYHEQRGELPSAIHFARRQLDLEPWLEEAHLQLMRLYLHQGQRSRAIDQYLSCVRRLDKELGIGPSLQTVGLFKLIQTANPHPPHNLPGTRTPLVGRLPEIAQVTGWLAGPGGRLITILGPGGMGKSRLALAIADKQLGRPIAHPSDPTEPDGTYAFFTHGVYWIPLSGLKSAGALVPAMAEAVGLQLESGGDDIRPRSPQKQLLDFLREKRILLILDNFEDLLEPQEAAASTGVIRDILRQAPHVQFLVTSRERLALPEEQLFRLQGLAVPEEGEEDPAEFAAVALFLQITQRLHTPTGGYPADLALITSLCRLLQGSPLAIELAANAVSYRSLDEIVEALEENLTLLATSNRHIPARHRSMEAAIATSWHRLPADIQPLYANLSVFQKGFTLEAARKVTRGEIHALSLLIDRSLLQFDPELKRYQLHELLRQFALDQLGQPGTAAREVVAAEHADFYLTWIASQEAALKGANQMPALKQLDADYENGRAAWIWACHHQRELIAGAIHPFFLYLDRRGRHQEGADLCRLALELLAKNEADEPEISSTTGRLLAWTGRFLVLLNRWDEGQTALEQSLLRLQSKADRAFTLLQVSRILWRTDKAQAQEVVRQSLDLANAVEDFWTVAHGHNLLGRMARSQGRFAAADHHLARSLAIRQEIDDQSGIAQTLSHLSLVMMDLGKFKEARSYAEQSLAIFQEMKEELNTANALNSIGLINAFSGQFEESLKNFARSEPIFSRLGLKYSVDLSRSYTLFATIFQSGSRAEFAQPIKDSFAFFQQAQLERGMGYIAIGGALNSLGLGEVDLARHYGSNGAQLFERLGQKKEAAECSGLQAAAAPDHLLEQAAIRHLETYGQFLLETRTFFPTVITLALLVLVRLHRNEVEQALALHTILMAVPFYANSQWFQDLSGKRVMAAANSLSAAAAHAIVQGSRPQDFWEEAVKVLELFSIN